MDKYYCYDCNQFLDEPDSELYSKGYNWGGSDYYVDDEFVSKCPHCGSENFGETVECKSCGQDAINEIGYCKDCISELLNNKVYCNVCGDYVDNSEIEKCHENAKHDDYEIIDLDTKTIELAKKLYDL